MQELKIKPEFQKLIPPLSEHEKEGLEAEIRYWARCYSPIITWRGFIADGHHRYAICQKYGLSFKTEELDMDDEDDVMIWMIDNQNESRRNIETPAKIRMGLKKKSILDKKAQKRKLTNLKQNSTDKENFPEREEKGQVRDIIGKNVAPVKFLYNLITDTKSFHIGSSKFLDYNGSLEVLDIF